MLLVRWRSRMGITWLRQCVIPFLTSSTRMHPTIPIHTMLCPEYCTASCDANLSRERFVPFGCTFGAPYSQLNTRQSSLWNCFNSIVIWVRLISRIRSNILCFYRIATHTIYFKHSCQCVLKVLGPWKCKIYYINSTFLTDPNYLPTTFVSMCWKFWVRYKCQIYYINLTFFTDPNQNILYSV